MEEKDYIKIEYVTIRDLINTLFHENINGKQKIVCRDLSTNTITKVVSITDEDGFLSINFYKENLRHVFEEKALCIKKEAKPCI